jgi:cell division protein FtsN
MKTIMLVILAAALTASCGSKRKMYADPFRDDGEDVVVVVENRTPTRPVQTPPTTTTTTTQQTPPTQEAPIRVQQERVTVKYGTSTKRYHIVVGSFANEENAIRLRNKLNGIGYISIIMLNESNMNRVSIAGFDDEFAAREELRRVRYSYPEYQDAWLLVVQ